MTNSESSRVPKANFRNQAYAVRSRQWYPYRKPWLDSSGYARVHWYTERFSETIGSSTFFNQAYGGRSHWASWTDRDLYCEFFKAHARKMFQDALRFGHGFLEQCLVVTLLQLCVRNSLSRAASVEDDCFSIAAFYLIWCTVTKLAQCLGNCVVYKWHLSRGFPSRTIGI